MISDWTDKEDKEEIPIELNDREKVLLQGATSKQIDIYKNLDQNAIEAMLVGNLIGKEGKNNYAADKIVEADITSDWFGNQTYADLFDSFRTYYIKNRHLLNIDEAKLNYQGTSGRDNNEAAMFATSAEECAAFVGVRKVKIELLIERMIAFRSMKIGDKLYEQLKKDRVNPQIGPLKAFETFRQKCLRESIDNRGKIIEEYEFIKDGNKLLQWLEDMKDHPDKYKGAECGIDIFDTKTRGFRAGQLTVLCGTHGGFKTTTMINMAFGLWERKHNVLYVSLEMEAQNVELKLLCRGAQGLSYSTLYEGRIRRHTDPEFKPKYEEFLQRLEKTTNEEDRKKVQEELNSFMGGLDNNIIKKYYEEQAEKKNILIVLNFGQSQKMKMSQLEAWLSDKVDIFKPDVVILDYLDLIEPEILNPNRLDVGFGDICKMSRAMGKNMGFAVITAAQMKRSALDRLRKHGLDSPEKAILGTDDISGSHMIGGDADNVFMLWRKDNGAELRVITAKSRYSSIDSQGVVLQVDHDRCMVADKGKIESVKSISNQMVYKDMCATMSTVKNPTYLKTDEEDAEEPPSIFNKGAMDMEDEEISGVQPTKEDEEVKDPI